MATFWLRNSQYANWCILVITWPKQHKNNPQGARVRIAVSRLWGNVGDCGKIGGGIVPLFSQEIRNKKRERSNKRHKPTHTQKVGAVVSRATKTPKPTNENETNAPPYAWDCVSGLVCVRVYMYIIPYTFISEAFYRSSSAQVFISDITLGLDIVYVFPAYCCWKEQLWIENTTPIFWVAERAWVLLC